MSGDADEFLWGGGAEKGGKNRRESKKADFQVNTEFASRYETRMRDERIHKLESEVNALEESIESDEEIEDELGNLVTGNVAGEFLDVYSRIVHKDPALYEEGTAFFKDQGELAPAAAKLRDRAIAAANEPKVNHFLQHVLDRDSDDGDEEQRPPAPPDQQKKAVWNPNTSMSYVEQQAALKQELKDAAAMPAPGEEEEEDDDDDEEGLLIERKRSANEEAQMEREFKEFLSEKRSDQLAKGDAQMRALWSKGEEGEDQKQAFLRDYILNNGWIEEGVSNRSVTQEEMDELSESEEMLEKADEFESKLNMRFEDPNAIVGPQSFPRNIASVRTAKPKARQVARKRNKERKKEERERLANELKQLKAQRRKEIVKQMQKRKGPDRQGHGDVEEGDEEANLEAQMEHMDEEELEKFLDDYLKMDFQDVVAKTRFQYSEVEAKSYGLQEEDILGLDDNVLEEYVPMRALATYGQEFNPTTKRQFTLKAHRKAAEEQMEIMGEDQEAEQAEREAKRQKREKKKHKKERKLRRKNEREIRGKDRQKK